MEPWHEANKLFHQNPHWLGADGAYSIDLGNQRTLWVFGDTFIDTTGLRIRGTYFIRNSIAIQNGYNPSTSSISFYWATTDGYPNAFFPQRGNEWYWPGHGIRVNDKLLIFLMRIRSNADGMGFKESGWSFAIINNPDDEPCTWNMDIINAQDEYHGIVIGSASVLRIKDYIYAFGTDGTKDHNIYLFRWRIKDTKASALTTPDWWAGEKLQWVAHKDIHKKPAPLFSQAQSEFTVHYDPRIKKYVQIQVTGFGATNFAFRLADRIEGPYSPLRTFYRPEESDRADALVYAGKAHPHLVGADLILTYVANSMIGPHIVIADSSLYYPKFLKGAYQWSD